MQILTKELSITSKYYKEILLNLKLAGGISRVVGGAVRNSILGIDNYDIDIATNLLPQQVTDTLSSVNIKVIPTGIKYGTVTALFNDEKLEITTLRKDVKCYGRNVDVRFTDDFEQDAVRRDFTINALTYCPFEHKIYDYFTGIEDLEQSRVRFIGSAIDRIQEDFLRILRFFRFSGYYAKQLDPEGLEASVKLKANLLLLSKERIKWEMDKLIISDNSPDILQQMFDTNILQIILPIKQFDKRVWSAATNRSLSKLAYAQGFVGGSEHRSAAYLSIREDSSLEPTPKLSAEVEFQKRSIASIQPYTRYSLLLYHTKDLSLSDLIKLKFSRQEAKQIIALLTVLNLPNHEINEFTLKKIWVENDNYFQYIIALVSCSKLDKVIAQEFLNIYGSSFRPIFPINGNDLQKRQVHGKNIGILIDKLKKIWIESNFRLNKRQLLKLLDNGNVA